MILVVIAPASLASPSKSALSALQHQQPLKQTSSDWNLSKPVMAVLSPQSRRLRKLSINPQCFRWRCSRARLLKTTGFVQKFCLQNCCIVIWEFMVAPVQRQLASIRPTETRTLESLHEGRQAWKCTHANSRLYSTLDRFSEGYQDVNPSSYREPSRPLSLQGKLET